MFDLKIVSGMVLDGTGTPARRTDIGITGDRITAMGDLQTAESRDVILAEGKMVSPGFIDTHSHSDAYLLIEPTSPSKVYQGVTTEVVGNCGASAAPCLGLAHLASDWQLHTYPGQWKTMAEYRQILEQVKPAVNVVPLVGHNVLRASVMGYEGRTATDDECKAMFPLVMVRKLKDSTLLIIAAIMITNVPGMLLQIYNTIAHGANQQTITGTNTLADGLGNLVSNGGVSDFFRYNLAFLRTRLQYQIYSGSLFVIFGFFILGMFAGKKGLLLNLHQIKSKLKFIVGFNIIFLIILQLMLKFLVKTEPLFPVVISIFEDIVVFFQSLISVFMFVSIVAMLFNNKHTVKYTGYLASLGKMALTNYLLQTVIGILLFYHVGLGLFGKTTPIVNFFIALAVFVIQVLFSNLWLRYFNYGIIEWLLRAGTLWKFKDLRKSRA